MKRRSSKKIRQFLSQKNDLKDLIQENSSLLVTIKNMKTHFLTFFLFLFSFYAFSQGYTEGDKLIESRWHQSFPYNGDFPSCSLPEISEKYKVGCGAIALSQILYYYEYPSNFPNNLSLYSTQCNSSIQNLQLDALSGTNISWGFVPSDLSGQGGLAFGETQKLLFYIARFIGSDLKLSDYRNYYIDAFDEFNVEETSSSSIGIEYALDLLGYDFIPTRKYGNYAEEIVKREIENCRPVIVNGENSEGGRHWWVISGHNGEQFYMNKGWKEKDKFLSLESEKWYPNDRYYIIGIKPKNIENACDNIPIKSNLAPLNNIYSKKQSNCSLVVETQENFKLSNNKIDLIWTDLENAYEYLVSIKLKNSSSYLYQNIPTYAGLAAFSALDILPPNEVVEISIKALSENGEIICNYFESFTTTSTVCNLKFDYINTKCNNDGTYDIEVDFSGLPNNTYDIYANWDGVTYPTNNANRPNSVSAGYYKFGPIPKDQDVALIIEDESMPSSCRVVEVVYAPNCASCSDFSITSTNTTCNSSTYNIQVTLSGEFNVSYNLYTDIDGINTHNNVSSGTYTFSNIPEGKSGFIFVNEVGASSACLDFEYVFSPNCSSTSCNLINITSQSPTNATQFPLGQSYTLSWNISSSNTSCLEEYELELANNADFSGATSLFTLNNNSKTFSMGVAQKLYWQVRTRNTDGNWGNWTATRYIEGYDPNSNAAQCNQPTGLFVTAITNNKTTVAWQNVEPDETYEVQWGIGNYNNTITAGSNDYRNLINLQSDQSYQWRVRTTCANGDNSSWSVGNTFTTLRSNQLNAHGDLQVRSEGRTPHLALCKGDTLRIDYRAYYTGTSSENVGVQFGVFLSDDTNYDANDILLAETFSSFGVSGSTGGGSDSEDFEYDVVLPYDIDQPAENSFINYILFVADYNNRFIETNEGNNVEYLDLEFNCNGCCVPTAHNYYPGTTEYRDIGGIPFCERYRCETCDDGKLNGDETGIDCGGKLCAPCGADCNAYEILSENKITSNQVKLHWSEGATANSYTLFYKKSNEAIYQEVYTSSNSITLYGLTPTTQYCWYVRTNCNTKLVQSTEKCFTTQQGIFGCTNPLAHNYTPNATDDNGT